jgi:hypothetical protein
MNPVAAHAARMKVQGSCHCGSVRYEAVVDPARVSVCHCTDCQRLTGSAFRVTVPALRSDFLLLQGSPSTYVKTADSGARRVQVFCANCGSPLYTYGEGHPERLGLRVGCIDQRRQLVPRLQVWCDSALDWAMDLRGVPRRQRD